MRGSRAKGIITQITRDDIDVFGGVLRIPKGFHTIAANALDGDARDEVVKIILTPDVKVIGANAFGGCYYLESVVGGKIESLGIGAFMDCPNLEKIDLSNIKVASNMAIDSVLLPEYCEYKLAECSLFGSKIPAYTITSETPQSEINAIGNAKIEELHVKLDNKDDAVSDIISRAKVDRIYIDGEFSQLNFIVDDSTQYILPEGKIKFGFYSNHEHAELRRIDNKVLVNAEDKIYIMDKGEARLIGEDIGNEYLENIEKWIKVAKDIKRPEAAFEINAMVVAALGAEEKNIKKYYASGKKFEKLLEFTEECGFTPNMETTDSLLGIAYAHGLFLADKECVEKAQAYLEEIIRYEGSIDISEVNYLNQELLGFNFGGNVNVEKAKYISANGFKIAREISNLNDELIDEGIWAENTPFAIFNSYEAVKKQFKREQKELRHRIGATKHRIAAASAEELPALQQALENAEKQMEELKFDVSFFALRYLQRSTLPFDICREGNEKLMEEINKFRGYNTDESFDYYQTVYEKAREADVKKKFVATEDKAESAYKYAWVDGKDVRLYTAGAATKCCFRYKCGSQAALEEVALSPDVGLILVLDAEGKTVGLSLVEMNELSGNSKIIKSANIVMNNFEVCSGLSAENNEEIYQAFKRAVADQVQALAEEKVIVENVAVGTGCNDLLEQLNEDKTIAGRLINPLETRTFKGAISGETYAGDAKKSQLGLYMREPNLNVKKGIEVIKRDI